MATTSVHGPIWWVAITETKGCRDGLVKKRAGKECWRRNKLCWVFGQTLCREKSWVPPGPRSCHSCVCQWDPSADMSLLELVTWGLLLSSQWLGISKVQLRASHPRIYFWFFITRLVFHRMGSLNWLSEQPQSWMGVGRCQTRQAVLLSDGTGFTGAWGDAGMVEAKKVCCPWQALCSNMFQIPPQRSC